MNTLLIFIKNAQKGKVKTRLAKTLGDDKALEIYKTLLTYTRTAASAFQGNRALYYSSYIETDDSWSDDLYRKFVQSGADLGQKMNNAFQDAFERGASKVVIVGSDCPSLTTDLINEAFDALDMQDFVLGPALDGGYYLLGMRTYTPDVFSNIAWSTDKVLESTIQRIEKQNKTYYILKSLSDIDYEKDWLDWKENL